MNPKIKILILDDEYYRVEMFHKIFTAIYGEDGFFIVWVKTAQDCIDKIKNDFWDLISLDHDLDGVYQDENDLNCGNEVARFIEKNSVNIRAILIHSLNYSAGNLMKLKIERSPDKRFKLHHRPGAFVSGRFDFTLLF